MDLLSIKGPCTLEAVGENIPDSMYEMTEFDEDNMEDGKPYAKNPPKDTAETDTPSLKQRDLSYIRKNKEKFGDGYDSDGEIGPFVPETIMVETVEEDDDIVPTREQSPKAVTVMFPDTATDTIQTMAPDDNHQEGVCVHIAVAIINGMKNKGLKNELYLWEEKSSGNKGAMIAQLTKAISEKKPKFTDKQIRVTNGKKKAPEINPNNGLKSFPASAYWRELKPNKERVVEPLNPLFVTPRAATVVERDGGKDFIKHDFDEEEFDIPLFKRIDKKVKRGRNGRVMFRNGGKKVPVYEHIPHTQGMVDPEFMKKHNLSSSSKPHKFVDIFLPLHKPKGKGLFPTEEAKNVPDFHRGLRDTCYLDKHQSQTCRSWSWW